MKFDPSAYYSNQNSYGAFYYISENKKIFDIEGIFIYFFNIDKKLSSISFYSPNITIDTYLDVNKKILNLTNQNMKIEVLKGNPNNIDELQKYKNITDLDKDLIIKTINTSISIEGFEIKSSGKNVSINSSFLGENNSFWNNSSHFAFENNTSINTNQKIFSEIKITISPETQI